MADISNAELKKEIQGILKDADLDNTSAKKVFREADSFQRLLINDNIDRGATIILISKTKYASGPTSASREA